MTYAGTTHLAKLVRNKRVFVLAALMAAVAVGYYRGRFRPTQGMIQRANAEADRLAEQLHHVQRPQALTQQLERLCGQLAERKGQLDDAQAALDRERQFASVAGPAAVQAGNLKLSELAERTHVRIRQRLPFVWPEESQPISAAAAAPSSTNPAIDKTKSVVEASPFLDGELVRELFAESLQRFEVEAPFAELRAFLDGLNELPWSVVVVTFDMRVEAGGGQSPVGPTLVTTLVLAL
jgi:hypothetical protein